MRKLYIFLLSFFFVLTATAQISLTGGAYTQDFNTLANTGTTNLLTITGWQLTETGGGARDNELYAGDNGASNSGDTYSYGATASSERALGGLQSGTLIPVIGANFTNNTGGTITQLLISYTGEQWRLGTLAREDRMDFQYSLDATTLANGTWTDVNSLDFIAPVTTGTVGALNGNISPNRTVITFSITGLSIPNGASFFIRWLDFNAAGSDDGLSVDDFSLTPTSSGGGGTNLSINDVSINEGNAGTTNFTFTVSLSAPAGAGGVSFDIASADNTATQPTDYTSNILTGQIIPAGSSTYSFTVLVNGDGTVEANEIFFVNITNVIGATVTDGQGQGTIINDDVSIVPIAQIQGTGNSSPLTGLTVTTTGIVTGRRSNGFFLQTPDANVDSDPNTSEGIFVFTSSAPPAAAAVGNSVNVTGLVTEFIPSADPNSPSQTELISPLVTLNSSGNALPVAILLTVGNTNPVGGIYQLEKFESMRVQVNSLTVVGHTEGTLNEPTAISTSNGFFYGVITGIARPFRESGIQLPDPLPLGAPATVTRWDANPELISIESDAIGGAIIDVATGALLTNVVGPLDYASRNYRIDIDPAISPIVTNNNLTYTAVPIANTNELTVASFNVERFFDTVDDPGVGDPILTPMAYANRLNKVSLAIRNVLRIPDIIGLEEVEKLSVLQDIATKVNNDVVAGGGTNPNYVAYLIEGNDPGGIDVAFLVKPSRVNVGSVTQYGGATTYINPNNGLPELLNDRPPLVLTGTFTGVSCITNNNIMVIVNHLRSLNGISDPVDGNRVRTKRRAQAEYLANLIQGFQTSDPTLNIVSVGDYNAFEISDGYVDLIGTIKGTPTPAANVVLASSDLVNPDLTDLVETYNAAERYSYSFVGNAQVLDHIIVNANLLGKVTRFSIGRLDADFPEVYRNDPNRPERISDHDAPIVYISYPSTPTPTITCPVNTTVAACQIQLVVNSQFASWLATASGSGGINGVLTNNNTGAPSACGGFTTVRFTYTNDCIPTSITCTATFTVTASPTVVLSCPVNTSAAACQTQAAVNTAFANWLATASASGGCNGVFSNNNTGAPSACGGSTTVTFTYTTASCSPAVSCNATFTVANPPAVTITCPAPLTVSCVAAVPTPNIGSVIVNSGCGVIVSHVSDVISNQTCANRYIIIRTYRGTDICGNSNTCTQIITVNDQTPPVLTCPANITVNTTVGSCTAVVNFTPTATDNCNGLVTIVSLPASGSLFPIGTTTVNNTATDACGNSSTCSFTITVNDAQPPLITLQPVTRYVCEGGNATFTVVSSNTINYQWQQWNGNSWVNIAGATTATLTLNNVAFTQNTNTYRVAVIGLCTTVQSAPATLFVNPLPAVSIFTNIPPALQPGQSLNISSSVNSTGGTYRWFLNGILLTGPQQQGSVLSGITVDGIGIYRLMYTDANGCQNNSQDVVVTGLQSNKVWVYPNPNTGKFQVRFFNLANEKVTVNLYDMNGARIYQKIFNTSFSYSRIDIDLNITTGSGVYLVQVINSKNELIGTRRIIVRH